MLPIPKAYILCHLVPRFGASGEARSLARVAAAATAAAAAEAARNRDGFTIARIMAE